MENCSINSYFLFDVRSHFFCSLCPFISLVQLLLFLIVRIHSIVVVIMIIVFSTSCKNLVYSITKLKMSNSCYRKEHFERNACPVCINIVILWSGFSAAGLLLSGHVIMSFGKGKHSTNQFIETDRHTTLCPQSQLPAHKR